MTLENIVYACYEEHKKHTSNWQHGKPQKAYYDLEGLKIFYEDGKIWHYNDSAQKTPAVRKNVRGMNAPITNNATIIPIGFSSGIVGFSWPDVLQNAVIRCIALLFQEKHFR